LKATRNASDVMSWRREREVSYLSFNEKIVISSRLHPITAALPLLRMSVVALAMWIGFSGTLGLWIIPVVVVGVQWVRARGYAGELGFVPVLAVIAVLALASHFALDTGVRLTAVVLLVVVVGAKGFVDYLVTRLFLTDKRIMMRSGLITERRSTLPLRALTDMRYDQTLLGRVLNYGHFFVESAGQNQALSSLRFVDEPLPFYRTVMELALGGQLPPEMLPEN